MIVHENNSRAAVQGYCDAVTSGRRVTGRLERAMVERYLEDLERSTRPDCPFELDERKASAACRFFSLLRHTDGEYAGQPFDLYPWQAFIVWNLFGFVDKHTRFRRFREAFLSVARGNGKTPFGAAIMLLLAGFDDPIEERAEVYTAAVKRDQAKLSFAAASRFISQSGLARSGVVKVTKDSLFWPRFQSTLLPLASEAKTADGLNIHGLLRDELHAWSEYQRAYYEKLQTALGKRRQPLAITITTAGSEESDVWAEQHQLAKQVVDRGNGVNIDGLFVAIYEIDDEDDELDPAVWGKANPMLEFGIVKEKHLSEYAAKAVINPTIRHQFRRYHTNKLTYSHNKAFTSELWSRGKQIIPWAKLAFGYAGVDLGWCDDLAAIGYCFPLDWVSIEGKSKRRWVVWSDVFCPRGGRRDLKVDPFATWVRDGRLQVTDSEWTDTAPIYQALARRAKEFKGIKSVAYDPNNCREFALNVENELRLSTFPFPQKHFKFHEPLKEFKIALAEGRILHGGDSLLGWASMNVVEEVNVAGHIMPAKKRSIDKIDPFVAVLMAFSEAMFAERQRPSVYESRGPLMIEV